MLLQFCLELTSGREPVPLTAADLLEWCGLSPSLLLFLTLPISGQTSDTDTTSQSGVSGLVAVLINALQKYQIANTPSNTTTVDLATLEDTGDEPVPVVDAMLAAGLADDAL